MHYIRAICVATIFIAPALSAEKITVDLDPVKTQIAFVLPDVLHTVHGKFQLKGGHISFDPARGTITGEIVVDAASGSSGSTARDKRMTRQILEAQRYPEIHFTPTGFTGSISMANTSTVVVTGSFLIHGQAHEITIPMQIQVSQDVIIATGKFIVPYVKWGMKDPSNFLLKVSDKVELNLTAVGHVNGPHRLGI
jgi:polyisoprenoid-binding protein YceI